MRSEATNVLVLDAGDFIASMGRPSEKSSIQLQIAAEFLVGAMGRLGYTAAGLGEGDLVFGDAFLRRLASGAGFPLLSGSVLVSDGEPFPPVSVVMAGAARVGIASVMWSGFSSYVADHSDPGRPMVLRPLPAAVARGLDLVSSADVKILLAHAPWEELRAALEASPGWDVVIAGHESDLRFTAQPVKIAGARVVSVGWDGKTVGRLDLSLDRWGKIADAAGSFVVLDETWPSHPELAELHERYLERVAGAIEAILRDYPVVPPPSGGRYVGVPACIECHRVQWEAWSKTKHSQGLVALVNGSRDWDPECFACHTTGFGYEGGFRLVTTTPGMGGVGCEECHGAGADHCAVPDAPYNRTDETTCLPCHQPLHSPEFHYATYRTQILHQ